MQIKVELIMNSLRFKIDLNGSYSEWVVRNAAAWAFSSENLAVEIVSVPEGVYLASDNEISEELRERFFCFLNDYRLRELIDEQTGHKRKEIMKRALQNVYGKES